MKYPVHHRRVPCVHALYLVVACLALAAPAPAFAEVRTVTGLQVATQDRAVVLLISSPGAVPLTMRSFPLHDPARLVFDLQGASLRPDLPQSLAVSGAGVTLLRARQFSQDPPVARLVLDLGPNQPVPEWSVKPGTERGQTIIVLSPPPPVALAPPKVERRGNKVEVRLVGAGGLPRQSGSLDNPPRMFIDLAAAVTPATSRQTFAAGPIREIRLAPRTLPDGGQTVRLVVELAAPRLYTEAIAGSDLVITLEDTPSSLPKGKGPLAGKLIVVDPGHGGGDSGAPSAPVGAKGRVLEKNITLDIALRLARLLGEQGASVILTRQNDSYLPLSERADLANRLNASAFVSIHCNSCAAPNTLHGTAVYYDHPNSVVFARVVQEELVRALGLSDNGIRNANFSVIRRSQCPGVLVETAYINDAAELALLADPEFRERAALGILKGVKRFFTKTVPSGASDE